MSIIDQREKFVEEFQLRIRFQHCSIFIFWRIQNFRFFNKSRIYLAVQGFHACTGPDEFHYIYLMGFEFIIKRDCLGIHFEASRMLPETRHAFVHQFLQIQFFCSFIPIT